MIERYHLCARWCNAPDRPPSLLCEDCAERVWGQLKELSEEEWVALKAIVGAAGDGDAARVSDRIADRISAMVADIAARKRL